MWAAIWEWASRPVVRLILAINEALEWEDDGAA